MLIKAQFDTKKLVINTRKAARNLGFSVVQGINTTAIAIQKAHRAHVKNVFEVRTKFLERQASIIKPFANAKKGIAFAVISVGQRKRLFLSLFEEGGEREPVKGKRVAVPVTGESARPTFAEPVPKEFRFNKLKLRKKSRRGGKKQIKGERRTFVIPKVGVLQRKSAGVAKVIYKFASRVRIKPKLRFVRIATRIAKKKLTKEIAKRFFGNRR